MKTKLIKNFFVKVIALAAFFLLGDVFALTITESGKYTIKVLGETSSSSLQYFYEYVTIKVPDGDRVSVSWDDRGADGSNHNGYSTGGCDTISEGLTYDYSNDKTLRFYVRVASRNGWTATYEWEARLSVTYYRKTNLKMDKVSVSQNGKSSGDDLTDDEDVLVDASWKNDANADTKACYASIYVDDRLVKECSVDELDKGDTDSFSKVNIGKLSAGEHVVKVVVDSRDAIDEYSESDNAKSITVNIVEGIPTLKVDENNVQLPATASHNTLSVKGNVAWTARTENSWITLEKQSGDGRDSVGYEVSRNTSSSSRSGSIVFSGEEGVTNVVVLIQQEGNDDITSDEDTPVSMFEYIKYNDYIKITQYVGENLYVNIPEYIEGLPVMDISSVVFWNCDFIRSVKIPKGVSNIEAFSFSGCSSLISIEIPDSVTNIGAFAFCDCVSLESVTIPDSITKIEDGVFDGCSSMSSITIPNGVECVGSYAFFGCTSLARIDFEGNAPVILTNVFFRVADTCTAYVKQTSTGWGVSIPGNWEGLNIAYIDNGLNPTPTPTPTPTPEPDNGYAFGPGFGSKFEISSSEMAYVVGVKGLAWKDFPVRARDNSRVFADSRIIDREKGSGTTAPDHEWCGPYADMVTCVWSGWSKYAGFTDEDKFANYLVANNNMDVFGLVAERAGKSLEPYKSVVKTDSTFAKSLSESFKSADRLMSTVIMFENYTWYGTTSPLIGHSVVCCGYSLDETKPLTDPTSLKGLFIIDPDNDREYNGGGDNAPDTIIYCPVSWNAGKVRYEIEGIFGAKGFFSDAYFPSVTLRTENSVSPSWSEDVSADKPDVDINPPDGDNLLKVSFDANGGTVSPSVLYVEAGTSGLSGFKAPVPTRDGYAFKGWFTKPVGGIQLIVYTRIDYDITYYAHWESREFGNGDNKISGSEIDGSVPVDAASIYDGYIYNGSKVAGTIQAKVARPKNGVAKVTVAIQIIGEKKVTLKDTLDVTSGEFNIYDTKNARSLYLKFGEAGVSGDYGKYYIDGARNFFSSKDKGEKTGAEADLQLWLGTLNMKCPEGVLSVTIAKKGKVTVKGTYDGAKVSAKAQALIGEDMICIPVMYSKKTVNLAFTVWLPIGGTEAEIIGLDGAVIGKAGTLVDGAEFNIEGDITELIPDAIKEIKGYDKVLPNGETVSVSGKKWVVAGGAKAAKIAYKKGELTITEGKKDKGVANASGLKLTYKSKDGSFTGSFTVYAIEKGKLKKHKATVTGVLIDGIGYGTATIKKAGSRSVTISR